MDLALGMLHRECVLTVPVVFVLRDEASGAELTPGQQRRLMGFKELDNPDRPGKRTAMFFPRYAFALICLPTTSRMFKVAMPWVRKRSARWWRGQSKHSCTALSARST